MSVGALRNQPCHCGSGKKFKKCHLFLDEDMKKVEEVRRHQPMPRIAGSLLADLSSAKVKEEEVQNVESKP